MLVCSVSMRWMISIGIRRLSGLVVLGWSLVGCSASGNETHDGGESTGTGSGNGSDAAATDTTIDGGASSGDSGETDTGQGGETDGGDDGVVTRSIPAVDTDPDLLPTIGDHFVAVGAGDLDLLFVFYPGTNAAPDRYSMLTIRAAELGYHALSLAYFNTYSINFDICNAPGAGPDCHELARLEILLGEESGYDPPDVDPTNAAFNRLVRLLQYLDASYPDEGWGAYLDGEEPRWDAIVFGGHSQGGGHAAMTAKLRETAGALLFDATEPSPWTSEPDFATPAERFYGFAHEDEPIFQPITMSWENLALPGQPTHVDDTDPPYGDAHRLVTATSDCRGDPNDVGFHHNCPVVDDFLPLDDSGDAVFIPVWDLMLGF